MFFSIMASSDVDHVKANTNALPPVTLQLCSDFPSVRHQSSLRLRYISPEETTCSETKRMLSQQ